MYGFITSDLRSNALVQKKVIIKTVLAFLDFCTLETFNDGTVTYYIDGAKKMWSMNWVGKGGPWPWFVVMAHAQVPQSWDPCCVLILNFIILYCYVNVCFIC